MTEAEAKQLDKQLDLEIERERALANRPDYVGDASPLAYGGWWADLGTWDEGYVTVLRLDELPAPHPDEPDAMLLERVTVAIDRDALAVWLRDEYPWRKGRGGIARRMAIVDAALQAFGGDRDDLEFGNMAHGFTGARAFAYLPDATLAEGWDLPVMDDAAMLGLLERELHAAPE